MKRLLWGLAGVLLLAVSVWAEPNYKTISNWTTSLQDVVVDTSSLGVITGTTVAGTDYDCTAFANGGALTADEDGNFLCTADDSGGNTFETISVPAGTSPVADSSTDTLTITETSPLVITGTAGTDTIDITFAGSDIGTDGTVQANAVALTTDTTGNYVESLTCAETMSGCVASAEDTDQLVGVKGATITQVHLNTTNTATAGQSHTAAGGANLGKFTWASGVGGGDSITVNTSAATDPDFADGDIDWTLTGGNSITATVACSGCIDATDAGTDSTSADELNATGVEAELETTLDIGGEVSSTGMASTVIADSLTVASWTLDSATATTLFVIPQGTGPTADDVGEIAHDTSDNQLILDDGVYPKKFDHSFTIIAPYASFDDVPIFSKSDGFTVTNIRCYAVGGTSVGIILTDNTNDLDTITCDTDGADDDGAIANATFTASEQMFVDTGTVTGAVTSVNVRFTYTVTRE